MTNYLAKIVGTLIIGIGCCNAQSSYTQKPAYSDKRTTAQPNPASGASSSNKSKSPVISGMISGRIIETNDRIIVDGAKFSGNGTAPTFTTKPGEKRQIIINNSEFVTNNSSQGLVQVETASTVYVRNLRVRANNASASETQRSCAGLVCLTGEKVDARDVKAETTGNSTIKN